VPPNQVGDVIIVDWPSSTGSASPSSGSADASDGSSGTDSSSSGGSSEGGGEGGILLQTSSVQTPRRHSRPVYYKKALSAPIIGSLLEYRDAIDYDDLSLPPAPSTGFDQSPSVDGMSPLLQQQQANVPGMFGSPYGSDPSFARASPEDYEPPLPNIDPQAATSLPLYDEEFDPPSLLSLHESIHKTDPILFDDQRNDAMIDVISTNSDAEVQEADWRDKKHYKAPADAVDADADPGSEEWSMNDKPPSLVAEAESEPDTSASNKPTSAAFLEQGEHMRKRKSQTSKYSDVTEFS